MKKSLRNKFGLLPFAFEAIHLESGQELAYRPTFNSMREEVVDLLEHYEEHLFEVCAYYDVELAEGREDYCFKDFRPSEFLEL